MPNRARKKTPSLFTHKLWQECYESWLRATKEHSGSDDTVINYKSVTRQFFADPSRTPDQYTRREVDAYIRRAVYHRGKGEHPPSARTQNTRLATLHSFYEYASQYDVPFRKTTRPLMRTVSPCRGIEFTKPGRVLRALTEIEMKKLFDAIPRDTIIGLRDYALLSCYFWCARRRSEIIRLKWGDIAECAFLVNGRPEIGHIYHYTPKGHSREVFTADLPRPAWEAIKTYLVESDRYDTMQASSPIFVRFDHACMPDALEACLHTSIVTYIMRKYAKLAGLDGIGKQVCSHSLRHTRARIQYKRRKDVREIQQLLGHKDLATTMVYLIDNEEQADVGAAALYAELGNL
jgi:integrase/recombinase XerD